MTIIERSDERQEMGRLRILYAAMKVENHIFCSVCMQ